MYWVYRCLNRHPDVSARIPENLGHQRTYVTEQSLRNWFEGLQQFLLQERSLDAVDFLSTGNADESGFPLSGSNGKLKIITEKGVKNVYRITLDTKQHITVLGYASALWFFLKPYVIFPGVQPQYNLKFVNPSDFILGRSINGWISSDYFISWITNHFYPTIKDLEKPVQLFLDGHTSHINLAVSDFCRDNDILYCLPPHANHIIQPLDVAVFRSLKQFWNDSIKKFSNNSSITFLQFFLMHGKIQRPSGKCYFWIQNNRFSSFWS